MCLIQLDYIVSIMWNVRGSRGFKKFNREESYPLYDGRKNNVQVFSYEILKVMFLLLNIRTEHF